MSDDAHIFRRLVRTDSDPAHKTLTVVIGLDDGRATQIDMGLALVGPLMGALAAEATKLNAGLTEAERMETATLNANAVWLSQDIEGRPMIVFELSTGSLLPLAIKSMGSLANFAAELTLLSSKPDGRAN